MLRAIIIVMAILLSCSASFADRRIALVFGMKTYEALRHLDNAVTDAQTMRDVLEGLGFEVTLKVDNDLSEMRRHLNAFAIEARDADVALVFFAGHGVEAGRVHRVNRLLPVDTDGASLETLESSTITLDEVRRAVVSAPFAMVILDACRNDPFGREADAEGRSAVPATPRTLPDTVRIGLGRPGDAENVLYAFAAAPGTTASDGDGDNSPFTAALARYLGTEGVEIKSALTLVQQEVYDLTRGDQLPYVESGLPRMFFAGDSGGELPERERLLLATAEITQADREAVERFARKRSMPLAPLYAVLIASRADRTGKQLLPILSEAADQYDQIRSLATDDISNQRAAELRRQAKEAAEMGLLRKARELLDEATEVSAEVADTALERAAKFTLDAAESAHASGILANLAVDLDAAAQRFERTIGLYEDLPRRFSLTTRQTEILFDTHLALGMTYFELGRSQHAVERFQELAVLQEQYPGIEISVVKDSPPAILSLLGQAMMQFHKGNRFAGKTLTSEAKAALEALALDGKFDQILDLRMLVGLMATMSAVAVDSPETVLKEAERLVAASIAFGEREADPKMAHLIEAAGRAIYSLAAQRTGQTGPAQENVERVHQILDTVNIDRTDRVAVNIMHTIRLTLGVYYASIQDPDAAEENIRLAIESGEALVANGKVVFQTHLDLVNAYDLLSRFKPVASDPGKRLDAIGRMAGHLEVLRETDPSNMLWARRLAGAYDASAQIALDVGEWRIRRESLLGLLEMMNGVVGEADFPATNIIRKSRIGLDLAEAALVCGDLFSADTFARQAVTMLEDLRSLVGAEELETARSLSFAYASSTDLGLAGPEYYDRALETLAPVLRDTSVKPEDLWWADELKRRRANFTPPDPAAVPLPPATCH